jgi:4-amino-4-deoxychorismate lyase
MFQFLETIKCKDGVLFNLPFHQNRLNIVRKENFGITDEIILEETIRIPEECEKGLFRCRITYSVKIEKIEFLPHHYRQIKSLKIVEDDQIDYRYKFTDRQHLERLFERRGNCDDILIIKNGCITDSFTANVIFSDGNRWWTPDTPLLPGTQRAKLLKEGKIFVCRITPYDLKKYQKIGLINAMQNLDRMPVIGIDKVQ